MALVVESGQWHDNVDQTYLDLASGKPVLKKLLLEAIARKSEKPAHLQNLGSEILRQVRFRKFPQPHELEEGRALPLDGEVFANLLLEEVLQELEVGNEAAAECPQELEQQQDLLVLVRLEVLEKDLDDDFGLLPVGEVDAVALLLVLLVVQLLVPDSLQ